MSTIDCLGDGNLVEVEYLEPDEEARMFSHQGMNQILLVSFLHIKRCLNIQILFQVLNFNPTELNDVTLMEQTQMILMIGFTLTFPEITTSLGKLGTASTVEHCGFNTRDLHFVAERGK